MWHYVYIIENQWGKHYIGLTDDIKRRLSEHNDGKNISTRKLKPWYLIYFSGFLDRRKAAEFELYLKSGSGRAFRNKHL
ncbi:GIY-YIG nuclease family protein [Candidatus Peregrinibacteria bacterium]|jgi:putative endonuclease|nr:GIY-YIG nuclease family protein [Candidatus Peregrinibacteria bacterium]MBT3598508.1 GIY-YIG nuclease family protein [Candidatus Peregrinibacteria bacterium]MBT4585427.1 GIY-YIG nuclease family protein [Candidatus Peregrinibacteria bacterium]MBT6730725.1 GIY-YIG nuclease family protein [Candidatus Peregrinibacteria bacterium]MBT7009306.1 GIY-YIG nuclease family protein [Candidatus Peregrinibacteria bacterium]